MLKNNLSSPTGCLLAAGIMLSSSISALADNTQERMDTIICDIPATCTSPHLRSTLHSEKDFLTNTAEATEYIIQLTCSSKDGETFTSFQNNLPYFSTRLPTFSDIDTNLKETGFSGTKIIIGEKK